MAKRKRLSPMISDYQPDPAAPASKPAMRAPIADVAAESSAVAALDALSTSMQAARATGRMVIEVPLDLIETDLLVRDRMGTDSDEMSALMASIAQRGQQTPIEVVDLQGGRFGLISGWRRCEALQRLHADTGDARYGHALALVRQPADQAASYLAMVEENEIRVGLSYYERARIAVKATIQGAFETEKQALQGLYANASRAKRSKIKSFMALYHGLDGVLQHPEAIGERLGLQIAQVIQHDGPEAKALIKALHAGEAKTASEEQTVLNQALKGITESKTKLKQPKPAAGVKTTKLRHGVVARQYTDGRIEIEGAGMSPDLHAPLLAWLDRALR